MFLSMTGFGRASHEFSWGTVIFEITSVNHKYQDFSARLPRELSSLENRMVTLMRNSIGRGKVKLYAEISWNPGAKIPVLDEEGLLKFFRYIQDISQRNNLVVPDSLTSFLLIPGFFDVNSAAEQIVLEEPEVWDDFLSSAINSLMEMKISEGEKLRIVVENEMNILDSIAENLNEFWNAAKNGAVESLRTRIETVMEHFDLEIDEARIAQEVSLMSDKWDVSEELVRLKAHCGKFRQIMDSKEPSGRRLDFLIQEMNREINTMGSKVADSDFRWGVVEAKSCLERIREQIQNIE